MHPLLLRDTVHTIIVYHRVRAYVYLDRQSLNPGHNLFTTLSSPLPPVSPSLSPSNQCLFIGVGLEGYDAVDDTDVITECEEGGAKWTLLWLRMALASTEVTTQEWVIR
jgi:hypothetical protein